MDGVYGLIAVALWLATYGLARLCAALQNAGAAR